MAASSSRCTLILQAYPICRRSRTGQAWTSRRANTAADTTTPAADHASSTATACPVPTRSFTPGAPCVVSAKLPAREPALVPGSAFAVTSITSDRDTNVRRNSSTTNRYTSPAPITAPLLRASTPPARPSTAPTARISQAAPNPRSTSATGGGEADSFSTTAITHELAAPAAKAATATITTAATSTIDLAASIVTRPGPHSTTERIVRHVYSLPEVSAPSTSARAR